MGSDPQCALEGRKIFFERYGVDPWGTCSCYDTKLFRTWHIPQRKQAVVLGINCGVGSNSLKIKEILKENGAEDVKLLNCTQEKIYLLYLAGISDDAFVINDLGDIINITGIGIYTFIIVEDPIDGLEAGNIEQKISELGIKYEYLVYKQEDGSWEIVQNGDK